MYLVIWVDDILLCAANKMEAAKMKKIMANRFCMKDFGYISYFLGIEFEVCKSYIFMHQSKYVDKVLEKFRMKDCHPKVCPCDASCLNSAWEDSEHLTDPRLYREIVGSLIYLMMCTRPDICFIVNLLSQHMSRPKMVHLNLAKFVLKYLKGSKDKGLIFCPSEAIDIVGYTDASWANCTDRKSISGYCFSLAIGSSLVSWKSKKQPIVTLSSCESEYVATAYAVQEGCFLQQLLRDFEQCTNLKQINLYADNQGAIELGKNPVYHQRSKRIDTRFHFIRDKVAEGLLKFVYVPSKDNVADIFTKPCTAASLYKFGVANSLKSISTREH